MSSPYEDRWTPFDPADTYSMAESAGSEPVTMVEEALAVEMLEKLREALTEAGKRFVEMAAAFHLLGKDEMSEALLKEAEKIDEALKGGA